MYHQKELNAWARGEYIYPIYVSISPSGTCNHKCVFCAYNYLVNEPVFLDKERIFQLLSEFGQLGIKSIFYSGEGEPFMNKSLPEIIKRTKQCGIDTAINTNGVFFTREKSEKILKYLTFIRISLNAGKEQTYAIVHKTKEKEFNTVLENIGQMAEIKARDNLDVTIGVQCLLVNENRFEIVELARNLKKRGADYLVIKPFLNHPDITYRLTYDLNDEALLRHFEEAEALSDQKFQVIIRRSSLEKISGRTYDKCLSPPFMVEIDCRGDVYPCGPFLGYKEMVYGNIYNNSFEGIWKSQRCKKVMDHIYNTLDCHQCMPNCRNDAVNRFLWDLKHPPEHVNFI